MHAVCAILMQCWLAKEKLLCAVCTVFRQLPVFLFMLSLLHVLGAVCFMCAVCAIVTQCWLVREQLLCSMYWAQAGQTCHCVFRLAKSVELIPQFHMPL